MPIRVDITPPSLAGSVAVGAGAATAEAGGRRSRYELLLKQLLDAQAESRIRGRMGIDFAQRASLANQAFGQRLGLMREGSARDADRAALAEAGAERDYGREINRLGIAADLAAENDYRRASLEAGNMAIAAELDAPRSGPGMEFDPSQQLERRRIMQAISEVRQRPDFTPDEKEYAVRQLNAQLYGIEPMPKESPFPPGQDVGQTWRTEDGGIFTRDDKGNVRLLHKPPAQESIRLKPKDFADLYRTVATSMETESVDAEGKVQVHTPDASAVAGRIREMMGVYQEFYGMTAQLEDAGASAKATIATGPDGKPITREELEATAALYGLPPELVLELIGAVPAK